MVSSRTRSRGQIMLVGAVALAFVILGLTAVYTAQLSARPASTGTAGVDAGNAAPVVEAGATGVAALSAITAAEDPEAATAALRAAVTE